MRISLVIFILVTVTSCTRDHKKETISSYVHYVWKRQPGEIDIKRIEDLKSITGKDSLDLLIKEYARGINPQPSVDTVLSRIGRDIDYNTKVLAKTKQHIDSLEAFQKKDKSNDPFAKDLIQTFAATRDFTEQTLDELRVYQSSFKRYSAEPEKVFCYPVLCQYKLRGHAPDTTSKIVTQTFFMTPDMRRIFLVK